MKLYRILKPEGEIRSSRKGTLAGYRPRKIFGALDCSNGRRLMKPQNRVFFHTLEDAVLSGYRPCNHCRPLDEEGFKRVKHLIPYDGINTLDEFYALNKR
ncbi:hypothetical protein JW711_00970 [Candidatus Woesearchaeota archaeon]|nr:hypothetical protein [Candidatus Woesearchaeota archaeon]